MKTSNLGGNDSDEYKNISCHIPRGEKEKWKEFEFFSSKQYSVTENQP